MENNGKVCIRLTDSGSGYATQPARDHLSLGTTLHQQHARHCSPLSARKEAFSSWHLGAIRSSRTSTHPAGHRQADLRVSPVLPPAQTLEPDSILTVFSTFVIMYLKGRESSHLLVHSPEACSRWHWVRPEPGIQYGFPFWVVGTRT